MRPRSAVATCAALALASYAPTANAWGAAGHEIVATIAQIHLHPSVLPTICALLNVEVGPNDDDDTLREKCHISTIATWADQERMKLRWSASMHYVGALDDYPRERCVFPGPQGWAGSRSVNVLDGMKNVTRILADWSGVSEHELGMRHRESSVSVPSPLEVEAFKFLVHFVGDMHQPLHLTGRARGGNGIKVHFGRRATNLHSVWDTSIPAKLIRTVGRNYSYPLPEVASSTSHSPYYFLGASNPLSMSRAIEDNENDDDHIGYIPPSSAQVEAGLRGTIYDALIRRIMWEGVRERWAIPSEENDGGSEIDWWGLCPPNSTVPALRPVARTDSQIVMGAPHKEPVGIDPDGPLICPYAWSRPTHTLNCKYIWPEGAEELQSDDEEAHDHAHTGDVLAELAAELSPPHHPPSAPRPRQPDLDIPSYMKPLEEEMIVEKLLAQGGLRLAGVLNWLFAEWEE